VMRVLYKPLDLVYVVVPFGAVFKNNNFWILLKSALFAILLSLVLSPLSAPLRRYQNFHFQLLP
jgi:hypothetical protein